MYEEINQLIKDSKKGDMKSKEMLLESLNPLIIKSIRQNYNKPQEYEDLIQDGRVIVLECLDSYDESKGTYFLGYLKHMLKYYYLDKNKGRIFMSLNEKIGHDEEEEVIDMLESHDYNALDRLIRLESSKEVLAALFKITDRQGHIVRDFYFAEMKIPEIAQKYNISYRTVVNTRAAAIKNLRKLMDK